MQCRWNDSKGLSSKTNSAFSTSFASMKTSRRVQFLLILLVSIAAEVTERNQGIQRTTHHIPPADRKCCSLGSFILLGIIWARWSMRTEIVSLKQCVLFPARQYHSQSGPWASVLFPRTIIKCSRFQDSHSFKNRSKKANRNNSCHSRSEHID